MASSRRNGGPPSFRSASATSGPSGSGLGLPRLPSRSGTMNSSTSSRLGMSVSSSESEAGPSTISPMPMSPSKRAVRNQMGNGQSKKGDEGSNIKVFVRVRGRAPGEEAVKAPVISTEGPKCSSVHVQLEPPPVSSLSGVPTSTLVTASDSPREKIYNFDNVFGPEADQGMVYQTVVTPALQEVLAGYNCTVFAYGQTGTGKTHTMEGDLTSQLGTYSAEAGIIPRTLYRLFHQLELSEKEYSVHASFVELYNEELRDLLSVEQPSSLAAGGLRMYDDRNKGVILQGLEDIPTSDAAHGLELLRRGSHKRQIAATNCNEASSRSHSIFTLTVHTKETTAKGEDVVRVGKLNLVDLAGSENIGRSGAENKRAREAGMINQSLLTLGRVINALVEKTPHIPYRESKLTRLLQESLGGRTKTCIIATVSAEKESQEETISTLDYALRAKSIKTRPEMNSRMTRAGLINEYVKEIEKLKRDVLAARLQEGVYISDESYKQMQEESEERKNTTQELRRVIEVAESKRASLQEQFEQNMQLLLKREAEVKTVKSECSEKKKELDTVIEQARELQVAVAEEKELREAYRNSERKLNRIAAGLRTQADENQSDLGGLFAKLERKSQVEHTNQKLVERFRGSLSSQVTALQEHGTRFQSSQEEFVKSLQSTIETRRLEEEAALTSASQDIHTRLEELQTLSTDISSAQGEDHDRVQQLAHAISNVKERVSTLMQERSSTLCNDWKELQTQLLESHNAHLASAKKALHTLQDTVSGIVQQSQDHLKFEQSTIAHVKMLAEEASQREIASVRAQNEQLTSLLRDERVKSSEMRERLAKSISDLVLGYTTERDESIEKAIGSVQTQMTAAEASATAFVEEHGKPLGELESAANDFANSLTDREKASKRYQKRGETSLQTTHEKLNEAAELWGENMSQGLSGCDEQVLTATNELHANGQEKSQAASSAHTTQKARAEQLMTGLTDTVQIATSQLSSTLGHCEKMSTSCIDLTSAQESQSKDFLQLMDTSLKSMQSMTRRYLSDEFAQDVPTGQTPVKRDHLAKGNNPHWKLVPGARQKALEQYRHLVAKKQSSLQVNRKRRSASIVPSEPDGTIGTLPDDSRDTIVTSHSSSSSVAASSDGGWMEDELLIEDGDEGVLSDGNQLGDEEGEDEDESLEDSMEHTVTENDETVKLPSVLPPTSRPSVAGAQSQIQLKRRAPTSFLGTAANRKVATVGRSISSAIPNSRGVLSEKNNLQQQPSAIAASSSKIQKKVPTTSTTTSSNASAGNRRITRA
ncbi:unnamed protein product [Sympodiomycopsis kandeliae]